MKRSHERLAKLAVGSALLWGVAGLTPGISRYPASPSRRP
jgi:hypothetical protein